MSKDHTRSFGGNRKGPGYRTPSSFRSRISPRHLGKRQPPPSKFSKKP